MKLKLHWQIFIAMISGAAFALILGEKSLIASPLGEIYMRLLKMVIVPLVFSSIVTGVAGLGDSRSLGRLGSKTFGYYFLTSMVAIIIGLTLTNIIRPGVGMEVIQSGEAFDPSNLRTPDSLYGILIRMIPTNPLKAAVENDILGVIFFSIVLGYVIAHLKPSFRNPLQTGFSAFFQAMMKLTGGIIKLAPIGVFGLIVTAVGTAGLDLFVAVGKYMITIALGIAIHLGILLPLIFYFFTGISPLKHYKAMAPAMAMAFSTSSSGATLPVTMDCVENNVNVSNRVTGFVLPLGSTMNMDGTALYECAGVLFIAQVLGFDLTFTQQLTVVITAFLASVGAAAIPNAGLVMIFIVLDAIGLSGEPGVGLLVGSMLAVDRPLDMLRTMTNVTSDSIGAAVIAKSEGETDLYKSKSES